MTESWKKKLAELKKEREENKDVQADARRIESELPKLRSTGTIAIMIRRRKGSEES